MSGEVWAIVGVVVGAVLGGGAQIVADRLNRAEARRQRQRDLQHAAYVDLLAAVMESLQVTAAYQRARANPEASDYAITHGDASLAAMQRLQVAHSSTEVVAPPATRDAAYKLVDAAMDYFVNAKWEDASTASERAIFVQLAKRDLGLD